MRAKLLSCKSHMWVVFICGTLLACVAAAQSIIPGPNVGMICGGKNFEKCDPAFTKQNEPSCAVSTRNPNNIFCGANDYRNVQWLQQTNGVAGLPFLNALKSFDAGASFRGGLIPGCPETTPDNFCAGAPDLQGFPQASDPTIASGPFGVFAYTGIANNLATNAGVVFAAIWVDDNNPSKVNDDTIRHIRTRAIDTNTGGSGQFQDKSWAHIDSFRSSDPGSITIPAKTDASGNVIVPQQTLPFGRIYAVWSTFVGSQNTSQIKVTSSIDGGDTWATPVKLSAGGRVQGSIVVVDPLSGAVAIFWRQRQTSSQPDAIMGSISINKGKSFSKQFAVAPTIDAFDQSDNLGQGPSPPAPPAIRINTFPAATVSVDYSGITPVSRIHVAWAERKGPFSTINGVSTGKRDSRIIMSTIGLDATGNLVGNWATPIPVDTPPPTSYNTGGVDAFGNPSAHGHQFFPSMPPTSIAGKISILYHDLRDDSTQGQLQCPNNVEPCNLSQRTEVRVPVGDLPLCPEKVFASFLADAQPAGLASPCNTSLQKRHYGDERVSIFTASDFSLPGTPTAVSGKVSRFTFGSPSSTTQSAVTPRQTHYEPFNNLLFLTDSRGVSHDAFHGDYTTILGAPLFEPNPSPTSASDLWTYNTNPVYNNTTSPSSPIKNIANNALVEYATWTSNRLVQLPPKSVACSSTTVDGTLGTKNQDTFIARVTQGPFLTTGRSSKPLSTSPKALTVNVHNPTKLAKNVQLKVLPPVDPVTKIPVPGATTSFLLSSSQSTVCATVERLSSISRTIFATSSVANAQVLVQVQEGTFSDGLCTGFAATPGGFSSFVVFNPDPFNPPSTSDAAAEVTTLDEGEHVVTGVDLSNSNNTSPVIQAPFTTEDGVNLGFTAEDGVNEEGVNEDGVNEDGVNLSATNEDGVNEDGVNEEGINEDGVNEDGINGSIQDVTTQMTNTGSTDVASNVKLLKKLTNLCTSTGGPLKCQLLVLTYSVRPLAMNCAVKHVTQSVLRTNIRNPKFEDGTNESLADLANTLQTVQVTNPDRTNVILTVKPSETLKVLLRLTDSDKTHFCNLGNPPPCIDLQNDLKPVPSAQSAGTGASVVPLIIIGLQAPAGTIGVSYSATVQAIGTAANTTWCVTTDGVNCATNPTAGLPTGLTLNSATGTFSGTPTDRGTPSGVFNFTVKATTPGTPQTDKQALSITINKAVTTTAITPSPASSVVGQQVTVNFAIMPNFNPATPSTGTISLTSSDLTVATCGSLSPDGTGSCTLTFTTPGSKTLTATYSGDNNYVGSSTAAVYTVKMADSTTTITSVTPEPSVVGQSYTVSSSVAAKPPGSGTPTGTVTGSDGTGASCGPVALAGGTASCLLASTSAGAKTVTITYGGDTNFNGSSGIANHQVNTRATTTTVSFVNNPIVVGQTTTVNVTVRDTDATFPSTAFTPTGFVAVTSSDGGDVIGSPCTLSGTLGVAACSVTIKPTAVGTGSHTITATFSATSVHSASVGAAALTVNKAGTTTTITSVSPEPSVLNATAATCPSNCPPTVNFTVSPVAPGAGTPIGTVKVSDGTVTCTATLPATSCTLPAETTVGSKTLTATYNGDANFNSSVSAGVAHVVAYKFIGTAFPDGGFWGSKNLGAAVALIWEEADASLKAVSNTNSVVMITVVFNGPAPASGICLASLSSSFPAATLFSQPNGSTGKSNLQLNLPNLQFNWDSSVRPVDPTTGALTGAGCDTVILKLNDGTTHTTGVRLTGS